MQFGAAALIFAAVLFMRTSDARRRLPSSTALHFLLVVKQPERLTNDLADGGMREDDLPRILHAQLHFDHLRRAPDNLAAVGADHVHANDRALFPMNQHLAQAVRALILRHKALVFQTVSRAYLRATRAPQPDTRPGRRRSPSNQTSQTYHRLHPADKSQLLLRKV